MNPLNNNSPFNGPLTPHQFKQNQNPSTPAAPQARAATKSFSAGRYVPLVLGGLALLVLPVTIWQINQQQDIRQQASQEVPAEQRPVARVGNEFLTDEDVDLEYTKQQNATTYLATPSSLKERILNDLVDKKLVQLEAKKRNITVTDDEINERINMLQDFDPDRAAINRGLVKDMLLAEKVALVVAPSANIDMVFSDNTSESTRSFMNTIYELTERDGELATTALPYTSQSREVKLYQDITVPENSIFFTDIGNEFIHELSPNDTSEVFEDKERLYIVELSSKEDGEFTSFEQFLEKTRSENAQISETN